MRVIDGMHRLMAASLKGQETIDVEFFDGSAADSFLRAVEANVTHGLPLSQADRRAAAARIIASHPQMSDRAIAASAGLAARTVASIRRSTETLPQLNARVGRDGRVRPLNSVAGRRRAAELMTANPRASLREIAMGAGVSPATARDVRERLERGEEPVPARAAAALGADPQGTDARAPGQVAKLDSKRPRTGDGPGAPPVSVLQKLLRDPSLRHNDLGRQMLRWLQHNAAEVRITAEVVDAVPAHCVPLVAQLAWHYAQTWESLARELDERARVIDPLGKAKSNGRKLLALIVALSA